MILKDKVVIISGVGPGMGRKLALLCAGEGAKIVVFDVNPGTEAEGQTSITVAAYRADSIES